MSVLSSKTVLVVGHENSQIHALEESLMAHGVSIVHMQCADVTPETVAEKKVDLVVLNHLHEDSTCLEVFKILHTTDMRGLLPVFPLIKDVEREIQDVLALGAADYITEDESIASITQKMKAIFGQGLDYSGDSVIDITPAEVPVSKRGIKVYIVEDDPLLRNLLSIRFEKAAFEYKVNGNGVDAVSEVAEFKPAVVILDLMLPGKDGFEVFAELKADQQTRDVPIIVFSNRDGLNDRKQAQELGAAAFYVKAMTDLSELVAKIESLAE
jgi:DNA-binding response OmpR family regulator